MSRRNRAKQLKELTRPEGREERLDIKKYLMRPKAMVSREELYMFVREYEYGVARHRWKRNILLRPFIALFLILSAPVRIAWKKWRQTRDKAKEADPS